jgi:hypothetical protein
MTIATATQFEVGQTYTTRSACDYDCIFYFTVIKRTAKFITVRDRFDRETRCGVMTFDGLERAYPTGRYSMAPVISADRK